MFRKVVIVKLFEIVRRGSGNADTRANDNQRQFSKIIQSFHFFGSFCFSFSTGANRSPSFPTRATVLSERNFNRSAFLFFRQLATSSQVTGVETVGSSLARSE